LFYHYILKRSAEVGSNRAARAEWLKLERANPISRGDF
jgi:hypothetical protein